MLKKGGNVTYLDRKWGLRLFIGLDTRDIYRWVTCRGGRKEVKMDMAIFRVGYYHIGGWLLGRVKM
jgi:hypothetical protein